MPWLFRRGSHRHDPSHPHTIATSMPPTTSVQPQRCDKVARCPCIWNKYPCARISLVLSCPFPQPGPETPRKGPEIRMVTSPCQSFPSPATPPPSGFLSTCPLQLFRVRTRALTLHCPRPASLTGAHTWAHTPPSAATLPHPRPSTATSCSVADGQSTRPAVWTCDTVHTTENTRTTPPPPREQTRRQSQNFPPALDNK